MGKKLGFRQEKKRVVLSHINTNQKDTIFTERDEKIDKCIDNTDEN